jgi:hypothetical protein
MEYPGIPFQPHDRGLGQRPLQPLRVDDVLSADLDIGVQGE